MSEKYDAYLLKHINAVNTCLYLLHGQGGFQYTDIPQLRSQYGAYHDESKFSAEEYEAYDEFFYPSDGSEVGSDPERKKKFEQAWLHHQNSNPHHWQYWLLMNDNNEGEFKALEIPMCYLEEMVADWGAFALIKNDADALANWYAANRSKQIIHPKSREIIDALVVVLTERLRSWIIPSEPQPKETAESEETV